MNGASLWVAYARTPGVTRGRLRSLMACFGDAEAAWRASAADLAVLAGWDLITAAEVVHQRKEGFRAAEAEGAAARKAGLRLVTLQDAEYPSLFRAIPDPPAMFYRCGEALLDEPAVAIVGSRKPTAYGLAVAERWGYELARAGLTVVSGMAGGVDSAAHRGALEGGTSVAVLGCGADIAYPRSARGLYKRLRERGAVISEYPPGTPPMHYHFPERNRLISGLSLGIIVVEAAERSGTEITARCANDQGRDVFAVPGPVTSPLSVVPHRMIRDGAICITSPEEVMEELRSRWRHLFPDTPPNPPPGPPDEALPAGLGEGPFGAEELAAATGRSTAEVQAMLTMLELKGSVRQIHGGLYIRRPG